MLLALDLASTVGYAIGDSAEPRPTSYDALRFGDGAPAGMIFDRFDEWLWDMIEAIRPTHIFVESPFVAPQTNANTVQILYGLSGFVLRACARETIIYHRVTPLAANRFFVGNRPTLKLAIGEDRRQLAQRRRGAKKTATIAAACAAGCPTDSDDAADAIALWFFGAHQLSPRRATSYRLAG